MAIVQVENLHKRYGKVSAVRGIRFEVQRGEIFGLIGPDGAGKTTTFQILAGVMESSDGKITVLGRRPRDARLGIGYLSQQFSLYLDLSIDENIRYSAGLRQVPLHRLAERRDRYLKLMNLDPFGERLAGQLSGGMKQKLALCCALIAEPEVLLLDEPTTGVDPVSRREFWDILATLAHQGVTIVVATPYLDEAERCNRIALMYEGEIQQTGTLPELRRNLGLQRLEVRTDRLAEAERVLVEGRREEGGKSGGRREERGVGAITPLETLRERESPVRESGGGSQKVGVDVPMVGGGRGSSGGQTADFDRTSSNRTSSNRTSSNRTSSNRTSSDRSSIVDVQSFGDRLDILVSSCEAGEAEVRDRFQAHHLDLKELQRAEATLENVFVTHLRQQGAEPPFLPFPHSSPLYGRFANRPYSLPPAIQTRQLYKTFGSFKAVSNVTLNINYGEIYGLLGANGAGKTTTIKMLCGLLEPSGGEIVLAGRSQDLRDPALRQRIGYMSQKFTLYDDLSVRQNLEFYCGVYGVPRSQRRQKIEWVLATCGLTDQENLLTGKLPGGWKQRVAFGASVMHEPEILFLDEPTSGVDPLARRQFWRLIEAFARQGTAVLVTTHYLEEAEHCNCLGFMVAGEVVAQGSPSQIKAEQPGQLLEMGINSPQAASDLLKTQMSPWRVSIFGDRLHVVVDDPDNDIPKIKRLFQSYTQPNGDRLELQSLRPVPFTLEDCFIGIVQRAQI
ncbi:ATP-binding cassette domain-containing protein [Egbenema bharatensis]|uniref:ATP-binding cassette domain-containing protein n=1 Tax=Egbenema bharatensis TaxID=3463334 RepID=UPI003A8699FE